MKKMYVVMEVEDILESPDFVEPVDTIREGYDEYVLKSRVIYADEMRIENRISRHDTSVTQRIIILDGVSPTPKPEKDEWEEWIARCPIGMELPFGITVGQAVKGWLRKMPREKP